MLPPQAPLLTPAATEPAIVLDPALCRWVLLPILVMMVLIGLLRHYITTLMSLPSTRPKPIEWRGARERMALLRSINLRRNAAQLPLSSLVSRRTYLIDAFKRNEYLKDLPAAASDAAVAASGTADSGAETPELPATPDPAAMEAMFDGVKKNMASLIPQTIIMSLITSLFSGFLLIRLPFPLTVRFKAMLQSGIMTPNLDAAWVSSLSWYFLNLFGLNPIFRLILGAENAADGTRDLTAMNPLVATATATATTTAPVASSSVGAVSSSSSSSSLALSSVEELPGDGSGTVDVQVPDIPQEGVPVMPTMSGQQKGFDKTFASECEFLELLDVSKRSASDRFCVLNGVERRLARQFALLEASA